MSSSRIAAVVVLSLRVVYGVALTGAPARMGRRWLGPTSATAPVQVPLRGLGAREAVLHTALVVLALRGGALRPWLVASIVGDLSDVVATAAGRSGLPDGAAGLTAAVALPSAALSAAVALWLDE